MCTLPLPPHLAPAPPPPHLPILALLGLCAVMRSATCSASSAHSVSSCRTTGRLNLLRSLPPLAAARMPRCAAPSPPQGCVPCCCASFIAAKLMPPCYTSVTPLLHVCVCVCLGRPRPPPPLCLSLPSHLPLLLAPSTFTTTGGLPRAGVCSRGNEPGAV